MKQKTKKIFHRILSIFMSLLMIFTCVNITGLQTVSATTTNITSKNPNTYEIPGEYGFRAKWTSNTTVTLHAPSGKTWDKDTGTSTNAEAVLSSYSDSDKGKVYALYSNVGTYNGKTLDVKITFVDWLDPGKLSFGLNAIAIGNATKTTLSYNTHWIDVKIEYLEHGTSNPVTVKGYETVDDLDTFERFDTTGTGITAVLLDSTRSDEYTKPNSYTVGSTIGGSGGSDGTSFSYLISGSSYQFRWRGAWLKFGIAALFDVETYKITTSSTNATITSSISNISYGSNKTITWKANSGYYISSVKIDGVSQSVDSLTGDSYTFSKISADHTVAVVASPYYSIGTSGTNATITPSITEITKGENKTVTWQADDGYYIASVTIDGAEQDISNLRGDSYTFSDISSNHTVKVVAEPCYKIDTEIVNGTITPNVTNIDPGEDKTIDFTPDDGYYVAEVIVDGTAYSYKDYASSYTFEDINENHVIKVVCEPLKTITTEIQNGVITKTMTNVHPDDSKEVIWNAFYEYYVKSVEVDGVSVTVKDFETGNYEFDPVITDHTVKVVCVPKPLITTGIDHGTITPSFTVFPGEDGITVAAPADGYYISRILVDGQEITDFNKYTNTYTFHDVTENHEIYVYTEKMPEIALKKTTDSETYNVGDIIQYNIEVTQTVEDATAGNVEVKDLSLPSDIEIDESSVSVTGISEDKYTLVTENNNIELLIDELYYNETVNILFDAKINSSEYAGKTITNTVTATCDEFNDQAKATKTVKVLKPVLKITKTADKDKYNVGENIEYTVKIEQTVDGAKAFNVIVTDHNLTQGIEIDKDSISVNGANAVIDTSSDVFRAQIEELSESCTITFTGKITDNSLAGKTVSNTADVTSETSDGTQTSTVTNEIYKPVLVIAKTADKEQYNVGDTVKFTVAVNQTLENAIAKNVVIKDTDISNGVDIDFDSVKVSGINEGSYTVKKTENGFEIRVDELSSETVSITYSAKINSNDLAGKEISNSATATCDNNPEVVKSTTVKPVLKPELSVKKTSDADVLNVGDTIEYTIRVNQTVENAIANNVIINDKDLTDGVELDLTTLTVDGVDDSLYTVTKSNNTFTVKVNSLAYGNTVTVKVKGKITNNDLAGQNIENKADATCDNNPDVVESAVSDEVLKPQLEITKSSDKEQYNVGDTVSYTIKIDQTVEGARANNVVLTDTIDDGMTIDYDSISIVNSNGTATAYSLEKTENGFAVTIPELTGNCTLTYSALIEDNSLAGQNVKNAAVVTSSNNSEKINDEAVIEVLKPQLEVTKTSDKDQYNVGDKIQYQITVQQLVENARANDVVIKDYDITNGLIIDYDSIKVSVPEGVEYDISNSLLGFTLNADHLNKDEEIIITFDATVFSTALAGEKVYNSASATSSNNTDIIKSTVSDEVLKPQLEVTKSESKQIVNVRDTIDYTIKIQQTVDGARANDVVLTDTIDDGMTIDYDSIKVNGIAEGNYTVEKTENGFTINIDHLTDSSTVTYTALVESNDLAGQNVKNIAVATASNNPNPEQTETMATVLKPELEISKTVDINECNLNDILTYTINIDQTVEGARANDVILTDTIDEGMVIDYDSIQINGIDEGSYTVEKTENGFKIVIDYLTDSCTVTYSAKVTGEQLLGKTVENIVSVTSSNNPDSKESQTSTNVLKPELVLTKTADRTQANKGDTVHYTVIVNQTVLNAKAFNVLLEDIMDDQLQLVSDSIQITRTDEYSIDTAENRFSITVNEISNTALVIEYDAKVTDDSTESVKNTVAVKADNLDDLNAEAVIEVLKQPVETKIIQTGDNTALGAYAFIGLASAIGIAVIKKKKKEIKE